MDDAKKAVAMWSMGFGDRNEALSGSAVKPARPRQRALKSDWKTRRMPRAHAKIDSGSPRTPTWMSRSSPDAGTTWSSRFAMAGSGACRSWSSPAFPQLVQPCSATFASHSTRQATRTLRWTISSCGLGVKPWRKSTRGVALAGAETSAQAEGSRLSDGASCSLSSRSCTPSGCCGAGADDVHLAHLMAPTGASVTTAPVVSTPLAIPLGHPQALYK